MLPALPTGMQSASSSSSERLGELERGRLLALDPELVDRVDQRDRMRWTASSRTSLSATSKLPLQRDHAGAVHQRLGELAGGDLAVGHDHRAAQARPGRVGGRRGGGVAGRGADDRLGALPHGRGHGARHPAVLERAGRVQPLQLAPHLGADALGQRGRQHQRRVALAERDDRVARRRRGAGRGSARSDQASRRRMAERAGRRPCRGWRSCRAALRRCRATILPVAPRSSSSGQARRQRRSAGSARRRPALTWPASIIALDRVSGDPLGALGPAEHATRPSRHRSPRCC